MFIIVFLFALSQVYRSSAESEAGSSLYSFITLGDWGGAALDGGKGSQDYKNVYAVAKQMASTAAANAAKFIVNTGDNFYWCGIQSTSDPLIQIDYVDPYSNQNLQVPWYSALGNHEYGYNVDAQIEYSKINSNWYMPDRYYTKRITLTTGVYATLVFIDSSPCISDYRNTNPAYWDPCSTTYPTCSLDSTTDDFEGKCMFHQNIVSQSCTDQYNWLKTTLNSIPTSDWLIIVGHHPVDEIDVEDFTTLIQNRGFSIYLNGHAHTLTQYTIDKKGAYVTSGAGSLVNTVDQSHPITAKKVNGSNIEESDRISKSSTSHTYQTIYNNKVAGFTLHTFSADFSTLTTQFVTYTGSVVHSFTVNKAGTIV